MATNTINSTHNNTSHKFSMPVPASQCIPWLVVLITECLAIVILNTITIIVFVKQRQLQRRSTYLIIHLAIVDLLVGAVSGPLQIRYNFTGLNLWKCNIDYYWNFTWSSHLILAFLKLFSFTSFNNLIAISLERLHATFRPFKHRFVKKWVYGVIIIVIWLIPVAREVAQIVLVEKSSTINFNATLYFPFYLIFPILICSCYILIVTKVRFSRHPRHHGSVNKRERKLTGTSLIVALISLLCMLPAMIITGLSGFNSQSLSYISFELYFHIYEIVLVLFLANSLINPIIYALRIPGFRAGVSRIFRGATANGINAQG